LKVPHYRPEFFKLPEMLFYSPKKSL